MASMSTQLGKRTVWAGGTPLAMERSTILVEMLETRVKASVKICSRRRARVWMGPSAGSRPSSKAASTSKSWTWSQEAAPVA